MSMDAFSWGDIPYLVTMAGYFAIALWTITFRRNSTAQRLYAVLCLVTAVWQSLWVVLVGKASGPYLETVIRIGYAVILIIPSVFYHFLYSFITDKKSNLWVYLNYTVSILLAIAAITTEWLIRGVYKYSWGLSPRAGVLHPIFVVFVIAVIVSLWKLFKQIRKNESDSPFFKKQLNLIKIATFVYCGGALDLISNYGISIFPISFIFTGVALILIGVAIIRYEFLGKADPGQTVEEMARQKAASEEMRNLGMAAAFPLVSQGEVLGYLLLGEKMSEESYNKEDLRLLRIVANQAALASQRVRYLEMAVHGARTEMLGEIAGGFAHEIKTPLANISLPAELSIMDILDIEQGRKKAEDVLPELKIRLKDIMQQTFKASEKIEAIRQFSKPGQQVQLEAVEISKVLQGSLGLLDHLLRKMAVKLKSDFPPTMTPIRGNQKQLEIVFVNLIKNAIEAMANMASTALARNLWLSGREESNWIVVSVKDSGPGMKRTDIGHLFEAYFTTKGSSGTGMGLFLSHQVIKAHGGSIEVKSEEGKGTEFIVRLPKFVVETGVSNHAAA